MDFISAVHTDIGLRKQTNQDSALIMEARTGIGSVLMAVLCDGMGGLAKGEVASAAVIRAYGEWFEEELPYVLASDEPEEAIFDSWDRLAYECSERIYSYGMQNGCSMGTTLAAILFVGNDYYIINVGDSRVYCASNRLYLLTKDQSFVQREVDMGRMTPEEAERSPRRNILLQCIGASPFTAPDYYVGKCVPGMVFMLCSDGFRHVVTESELYDNLNPRVLTDEKSMLDRAYYLTELNKSRNETDNITVALLKTVNDEGAPRKFGFRIVKKDVFIHTDEVI